MKVWAGYAGSRTRRKSSIRINRASTHHSSTLPSWLMMALLLLLLLLAWRARPSRPASDARVPRAGPSAVADDDAKASPSSSTTRSRRPSPSVGRRIRISIDVPGLYRLEGARIQACTQVMRSVMKETWKMQPC